MGKGRKEKRTPYDAQRRRALNCPSSLRISENEKELSIVFHVCTDHLHHLVDLILFFSGTSFFQNVEDERHFLWSELDPFLVRTGDERHHNGSQRSPAFSGGLFTASRINSSLTGSIPFMAG